jgi:hypothetical protein
LGSILTSSKTRQPAAESNAQTLIAAGCQGHIWQYASPSQILWKSMPLPIREADLAWRGELGHFVGCFTEPIRRAHCLTLILEPTSITQGH